MRFSEPQIDTLGVEGSPEFEVPVWNVGRNHVLHPAPRLQCVEEEL